MDVEYRKASDEDFSAIVEFVDFWLTGGGKYDGVVGASHDYFVRTGMHKKYLAKYSVWLATYGGEIVGWAVKTHKGVLIHLLVAGTFRGRGIGSNLLQLSCVFTVRSKFDQESGDPSAFYEKHGFVKQSGERVGRRKNIDVFVRPAKTTG